MKINTYLLIVFGLLINAESCFSQNKYNQEIQVQHDNDILTLKRRTADRYYSFGIHLDYRNAVNDETKFYKWINKSFNKLDKLIINWHLGIEGYTSDMDRDVKVDGVFVEFDRPYAGWLFLENKVIAVTEKALFYSKITAGVIGPISGAENVQDNMHKLIGSPKFTEWKNQIQNEFAGNIGGGINYPITRLTHFDIHSETELSLGTHSTYLKQGFIARVGLINAINNSFFYHTNLNNANKKPKKELYLDFGAYGVLWGYKSTIEGRVFGDNVNMNTNGLNVINADIILGINYAASNFSFFYKSHLITAETDKGRHFYYGSVGFSVKL